MSDELQGFRTEKEFLEDLRAMATEQGWGVDEWIEYIRIYISLKKAGNDEEDI